jgi:hypothetical protein
VQKSGLPASCCEEKKEAGDCLLLQLFVVGVIKIPTRVQVVLSEVLILFFCSNPSAFISMKKRVIFFCN